MNSYVVSRRRDAERLLRWVALKFSVRFTVLLYFLLFLMLYKVSIVIVEDSMMSFW